MTSAATDLDLLEAHLSARTSSRAFDQLIERHWASLWKVCLRTLRHHQDAEDALQEVMTRAHRHAGSFRGEATVGTWLHRIAVNTARAHRAHRARDLRAVCSMDETTEQMEDPAGREGFEQVDTNAQLEAALDTLPEVLRDAFLLVAYLEFTVGEAARMLDVPAGTVKSRVWRARRHLQPLVAEILAAGNP